MPTQRFLNLKESKKNAILEAAANEFARVPYSAVSINQIIKEAEISRGSFYTYFEDKDDLMRYMLRGFRDTLRKKIFDYLEEEKRKPIPPVHPSFKRMDENRRRKTYISDPQKPVSRLKRNRPKPNVRYPGFSYER